jgi:hypothetical protein
MGSSIPIHLQVPRLKQTFSLNLQNSVITVRLSRAPCRRREAYRSLGDFFRWTDRNFPQFHLINRTGVPGSLMRPRATRAEI